MWKTISQVREAVEKEEGMLVSVRKDGASPYSSFDLVVYPSGFRLGVDPGKYEISSLEVKSCDPAEAYKGRHGVGRLIRVTPAEDGLVRITSNEEVILTLKCGMNLGIPAFQKESLSDWFSEDQVVWSSE
jgi:hypothetical protein